QLMWGRAAENPHRSAPAWNILLAILRRTIPRLAPVEPKKRGDRRVFHDIKTVAGGRIRLALALLTLTPSGVAAAAQAGSAGRRDHSHLPGVLRRAGQSG